MNLTEKEIEAVLGILRNYIKSLSNSSSALGFAFSDDIEKYIKMLKYIESKINQFYKKLD